eukprot:maker-scaffold_7-snap-gene-16.7-mRNA-1 protein AED:0.00 eAED:0.00 QI:53/1/1/1/1/1/3/312/477
MEENLNEHLLPTSKEETPSHAQEFQEYMKLALPSMLTCIFEVVPGIANIIVVGNSCTKEELDATALGIMFTNVFGISLGIGFLTAFDTLCPQAVGAGLIDTLPRFFQKGLFLLAVLFIPVITLHLLSFRLFSLVGQPLEISELASKYLLILVIGVPFIWTYELARKHLQSLSIVKPLFCIAGVANIFNVSLTYVFINVLEYKYTSAAVASVLSWILMPSLLYLYIMLNPLPYPEYLNLKKFFSFTKDATTNLMQVVTLGIPGLLGVCLEWWAFETLAIFSGWTAEPDITIASNAVMMSINNLAYMIYLGASIAATVRVGLHVGARKEKSGRVAVRVSYVFMFCLSLLVAGLIYILRNQVALLFLGVDSTKTEARNLVAASLPILCAFQVVDSANVLGNGIMKALGNQRQTVLVNCLAFYVIGLPCAWFIAFSLDAFSNKIISLWSGIVLGVTFSSNCFFYLIWKQPWAESLDAVSTD